jgi:8-oxo-dGTP pyrophosphatase MutT (NUDIX family)
VDYPVRVVATGLFQEGDIEVVKEELPPLPVDVAEKVEHVWQHELERNPKLTPGPLLAARSVEVVDNGKRLLLRCGESTYKNFMGTTHETVAPTIAEEYRHRAIGFLAVIITADNYLLLGVRSPKIDWGTLRHVVPAGRLRPDEKDPYTGIRAEFKEELGLEAVEIRDLTCIGVVADETWGRLNYEFCFQARTEFMARELIEIAKSAKSAGEHCQLEPFLWEHSSVSHLLLVDPESFVPTGWAGVALCLWNSFGLNAFPRWETVHRTYAEHMGRRLAMLTK